MNPEKISVPIIVFHITNVCNYNCEHCQTFSNFNFTGHQLWEHNKSLVAPWADKLSPEKWQILGGEPTANPGWKEWVTGLCEVFPGVPGELSTNGSVLKYNQDLYDFFANLGIPFALRIQTHNTDKKIQLVDSVRQWLTDPVEVSRYNDEYDFNTEVATWVQSYNNVKDTAWPSCNTFDECCGLPADIIKECVEIFDLPDPRTFEEDFFGYRFVDANNITVTIQNSNRFGIGPLIPLPDRSGFRLHNSDPVKAHQACISSTCRNIVNGKWYKCHTVAHLENFAKQYKVEFDSDKDQDLLSKYQAATPDMSVSELAQWYKQSRNPIPQCKFCPENMEYVTNFKATTKKIFFQRKIAH